MATLIATPASGRTPALDAVRGLLVLGVLVVNIQFMAAPVLWADPGTLAAGGVGSINEIASGLVGWLLSGKLISGLAFIFGAGMGIIAARSLASGRLRRWVFFRRSLFLIVLGLLHMVLLFPGDILFAYGVTGLIAIAFLRRSVSALLWWAGGFASIGVVLAVLFALLGAGQEQPAELSAMHDKALDSYGMRDYTAIVAANAFTALVVQGVGLINSLTWILPLFLLGIAAARRGLVTEPAVHARALARTGVICVVVGLIANLPFLWLGAYAATGVPTGTSSGAWLVLESVIRTVAVPVLGLGYVACLLAWWSTRRPWPALVSTGRMALTAYLMESALALAIFIGLGWYGQVGVGASIAIAAFIWAIIIPACMLWLRRFDYGPFEWLWRLVTYLRKPGRAMVPQPQASRS